jgi:hypothetical protein
MWSSLPERDEARNGVVERGILRPTEFVMDIVASAGARYSVRLARTGENIFQGNWRQEGGGGGSAECTIGPIMKTLGIKPNMAEEPTILEFEGRWTENGEWWLVGRLEEVKSF